MERSSHSRESDPTWDEKHVDDVLHFVESTRQRPILGDSQELIARALTLAECTRLPAAVRFKAANVALRAGAVGFESGLAERSYQAALRASSDVLDGAWAMHELNLFYHTWFGDLHTARSSALWLSRHTDARADKSARITLRSNLCYALRVTGETDQAYALCGQVFAEAVEAGMIWIAALVAWNASLIALDAFNDPDLAQSWLHLPECRSPALTGQHSELVIQENRVRIAIVRNLPTLARHELDKIQRSSIDFAYPFRAAYYYAMQVGTAVIDSDKPALELLLPQVIACFSATKRMIGQDFLAHQLVMALRYLDRHEEAQELLREYLHESRRSKSVVPRFLSDAASDCGVALPYGASSPIR